MSYGFLLTRFLAKVYEISVLVISPRHNSLWKNNLFFSTTVYYDVIKAQWAMKRSVAETNQNPFFHFDAISLR